MVVVQRVVGAMRGISYLHVLCLVLSPCVPGSRGWMKSRAVRLGSKTRSTSPICILFCRQAAESGYFNFITMQQPNGVRRYEGTNSFIDVRAVGGTQLSLSFGRFRAPRCPEMPRDAQRCPEMPRDAQRCPPLLATPQLAVG
jgi:hypothetical protein